MSDTIDKPICATCVRLREGFCDGEHRMSKGSCDFYKRMTNADRIRAMTDEELAKFLCATHGTCASWCPVNGDCDGDDCDRGLLDWLREDVASWTI